VCMHHRCRSPPCHDHQRRTPSQGPQAPARSLSQCSCTSHSNCIQFHVIVWLEPTVTEQAPHSLESYSVHFMPLLITLGALRLKYCLSKAAKCNEWTWDGPFASKLIYCTISFNLVVTCHAPPCRDEFWSRSWVTVPKCKVCDIRALLEVQKRQNFRNFSSWMPNFSRCHTKICWLPKCWISILGHGSQSMPNWMKLYSRLRFWCSNQPMPC
jgi:hypothetical protein